MPPELTILIPCAPHHADLVKRAVASCAAQTVQVYYGVQMDTEGLGPGWARNQLLGRVNTPYVTFLDADDWLESNFAEVMLAAMRREEQFRRYVYCGWIEDFPATDNLPERSDHIEAPVKAWCGTGVERDSHLITSVYLTQWAHMINGFDQTLPGMEDVDFVFKMRAAGHCGTRVNEFLVHYTDHGTRSDEFRLRADRDSIVRQIMEKYRGTQMACCNDQPIVKAPMGDRLTGDVLALELRPPLLAGYQGRVTSRRYTLNGMGAEIWIDPADAVQDPARFRVIPPPIPRPPEVRRSISTAAEVAEVMSQQPINQGADVYLPQNDLPGGKGKIDVEKLRKLAGYKK